MPSLIAIIAAIFVGIVVTTINVRADRLAREHLRRSICSGDVIDAGRFEQEWIIDRRAKLGYKYSDRSGCYVILVFDDPPAGDDYSSFDDVYVGQSVNICQRVHNHLRGKGNGDIYADMRSGRSVFVKFIPCRKEDMNRVEREHIEALDATSSYNATRGGSRIVA